MMRTKWAVLAMGCALAGCGSKGSLEPKQGQALPPPAYGREVPKDAQALLEPPVLALPERSVELRTRSEVRDDDPFDLPPPE